MKNELTARRIRKVMRDANMKAQELAERSGISKASISQYVNGVCIPNNKSAGKLAEVLKVSPAWLMGFDVPVYESELYRYENIQPLDIQRFPVLGKIACGEPVYMNEELDVYTSASIEVQADFILVASGDSMINARIHDGDFVFIKMQSIVRNGEIAAVAIDDEATLKRFYYYPERRMIILKPENSKYEDMIFVGDELKRIRVLGKAVCFQGNL